MSEEEYIRNRLDMINRNSVYGLMIDSEITKIVRSHIKRDIGCDYDRLNCPKPPIYIGPVKVKSLKEKIDNYKRRKKEMKATSVQNIKNVNDICFSIENYPAEMESKLTIVASTNDDIFAFEFEGPDLLRSCKTAGLFTGWEKDQKIGELEKENKRMEENLNSQHEMIKELNQKNIKLMEENEQKISGLMEELGSWEKDQKIRELKKEVSRWKKEAADCLRLRDETIREKNKEIDEKDQKIRELKKENKELQGKYDLEKAANEAQRKFIKEYAGKGVEIKFNYAIDEVKEVTYVIVDKEEYDKNFKKWLDAQVEQDNNKNTREYILDQAKKCVCGKREQDYGTPESNFQLIADLWNQYLFKEPGAKEVFGIGPMDVAMMMGLMKIARIRNGGGSGDSFVDLAGYAACGGEIWHSNKETDGDSSQETN